MMERQKPFAAETVTTIKAALAAGIVPPLRKLAGVSSEAMNRVYAILEPLDLDHLGRMWDAADPYTAHGALLRWQIGVELSRRFK